MPTDLSRLDRPYGNTRNGGLLLIIEIPDNSSDIYNLMLRAQYVANKPVSMMNSYNFLKINSLIGTLEIWDHEVVPWMHSGSIDESTPERIERFMSIPIPSQFVISRKWYFETIWYNISLLFLLVSSIIFSIGIIPVLMGVSAILALYYSVCYYQYRDFKSKSSLMMKQYRRVRMLFEEHDANSRFIANIPDMLYVMNVDKDTGDKDASI